MRVVFMGSPPFAGPVFDALIASARHDVVALVTRPSKPRGRGMKVEDSALTADARARGIPVLQPERARGAEFIERLREFAPDVAVVASFGEILKQDVLDLPRHGCLNVHASLLPRHRGASPIQAAILAGDVETGVTIQRMVLALDEGDIVHQERTPIAEHETAGELLARLATIGGRAALNALDQVASGTARYVPQDPALATFATRLKKEHGLVDWSKSAVEVERLVRAFTPWPGARTKYADQDIGVLDVRVCAANTARGSPGTILSLKPAVLVACGDGALEIRALKPAGKGRMDAAAWSNGARPEVGSRFGVA